MTRGVVYGCCNGHCGSGVVWGVDRIVANVVGNRVEKDICACGRTCTENGSEIPV